MIPYEWNRQREAGNNQQDPGSMEGALEEEMFPGGWNRHVETNYTEYYTDHGEERNVSQWMDQSKRGR